VFGSSSFNNSAVGYYADGFFDRRYITNNAVVSADNAQIAYTGYLRTAWKRGTGRRGFLSAEKRRLFQ